MLINTSDMRLLEAIFYRQARRVRRFGRKSTYTKDIFSKHIDKDEVGIAFELGSRDLKDSLAIRRHYNPESVYSFECNPESIDLCKEALKRYWLFSKGINLIPKAVWHQDGKIKFYSVKESFLRRDPSVSTHNIGSSSCFGEMSFTRDDGEEVQQREVEVDAVRLDSFCTANSISQIDLLCMDLEGAEYDALVGAGDLLNKIKYVITELHIEPHRKGQKSFEEVRAYLENCNFRLKDSSMEHPAYGNFLFINANW